jgi:hypothetical protein
MCAEFWSENMVGTDHLADLDTDGCMVLGFIIKKYYGGWINLV